MIILNNHINNVRPQGETNVTALLDAGPVGKQWRVFNFYYYLCSFSIENGTLRQMI